MTGYNLGTYLISLFLLGIMLIVLGSIISASSVDACMNTGSPASIWGMGLLIVLTCLVYFYLKYKSMVIRM